MKWEQLLVVALEAPDAGGLIATAPFVTSGADGIYRVIDITETEPRLSPPIPDEEFHGAIRNGAWLEVPRLKAARGYLGLVLGPAFYRALITVGFSSTFPLIRQSFDWTWAYQPADQIESFQQTAADCLLEWTTGALTDYLRTGLPKPDLIDGVGHHAISATTEGSPQRRRLYVLLGAVASQFDRQALEVLKDFAGQEFGLSPAAFSRLVDVQLAQLAGITSGLRASSDIDEPGDIFGSTAGASLSPIGDLGELIGTA